MQGFSIGERKIGEGSPVFIIAEAGSNFRVSNDREKNFSQALRMIGAAAEAGADAVKFQLFSAEKLYVKEAGSADYVGDKKPINQIIEEMELPPEWIPKLKEECEKKGLVFLCTPFDEKAADLLEENEVAAFKIASYTITHIPLIRHIARKKKPVILSVGASGLEDVERAVDAIRGEGNNEIALLQCTAKYPAPLSAINLRAIPALEKRFDVVAGLSDHSREPLTAPLGSVALGAKVIEKHFTIDNSLPGPDQKFAVTPKELRAMVSGIRGLELALGRSRKEVLEEERELFDFCRRHVYASRDIQEGEILSAENLVALRPGKAKRGIGAERMEEFLGKKAKRGIRENEPLGEDDFK